MWMDSPSSTSALVYKLQVIDDYNDNLVRLNGSTNNADDVYSGVPVSTIHCLTEIWSMSCALLAAFVTMCPVLDTSGITVPFYAHEKDPMLSAIAPFGYVKDYDNNCYLYPQHHLTTISLNDLLQKHGAPSTIDYISIDVEGFEKRVLETFNFTEYDIKCWTVEANGPDTELILDMFKHENYTTELRNWDIFGWR